VWEFSSLRPVERGAWLSHGRVILSRPGAEDLDCGPALANGLLGDHNVANILAAAAAAHLSGADEDDIRRAVSAFVPPKHRLQLVWRAGGTEYYDDLNATSPHATIAAFRALSRQIVWIAGGDEKGLEVGELVAEAGRACRCLLLLPGVGSERLFVAVTESKAGPPVERFDDLRSAVARAARIAGPQDAVLLSPAFPGFFSRNYSGDGGYRALLRELAVGADPLKEVVP
jgi:UDP-N-acetylmuramoylalanine--D-glutamate ligase